MSFIPNALTPYLNALKVAVLLSVLLFGMWGGCAIKEKQYKVQLIEAKVDRDAAVATYNSLIEDIKRGNEKTEAARGEDARLIKENEELSKQVADEKKKKAKEQKDWEKKLDAAAKDPDCKAILEANLCPLISDY
jgi:hypothetical protein